MRAFVLHEAVLSAHSAAISAGPVLCHPGPRCLEAWPSSWHALHEHLALPRFLSKSSAQIVHMTPKWAIGIRIRAFKHITTGFPGLHIQILSHGTKISLLLGRKLTSGPPR